MDRRSELLQRLAEVEQKLADDERAISRQLKIIESLVRRRRETAHARMLLANFEAVRRLHKVVRSQLLQELGD